MKESKQTFIQQYFRYDPESFMPIYSGSELVNKWDFHKYKLTHMKETYFMLTHQSA